MGTTPSVAAANAARNGRRERGRRARWTPARDALWDLLGPLVHAGARVAVVGAGNGDDLPLARIAERASRVALLDVDAATAGRARGRVRRGLRRRVVVVEHDVTLGAADEIVAAAVAGPGGRAPDGAAAGRRSGPPTDDPPVRRDVRLPGGPYDLVVGDLFYSQLLYPALLDAGVPQGRRRLVLSAHGRDLTRDVVARLQASAPTVVHLHDRACWGNGYDQPASLGELLALAEADPDAALRRADGLKGPREADPRDALRDLGVAAARTRMWGWPFTSGVEYLVVATVCDGDPAAVDQPSSPEGAVGPSEPRS